LARAGRKPQNAAVTFARQFALPFPQADHYAPADFLPGACNATALAWMAAPRAWPALRLLVHGPVGAGKTHLLHLFAARHGAALLPAAALRRLEPPPEAAALALDDADDVPDPRALLHVLNAAAERGTPVLLAARTPPAAWTIELPDLASRLRATTSVAVLLPEDDLLRPLLARLLADRQLIVPEKLQDFLLARLPRSGGALREAAARLDRLSLAEGRTVSRDIAARVVLELSEEGQGALPPGPPLGPEAPDPHLFSQGSGRGQDAP
jgi:chromosomal replication initiation ATPase DnaA